MNGTDGEGLSWAVEAAAFNLEIPRPDTRRVKVRVRLEEFRYSGPATHKPAQCDDRIGPLWQALKRPE